MSQPEATTVTVEPPSIRILIVEDQPTSALILQGGIATSARNRRIAARIATAHSAAAAIDQIEANPPDAVLLDLVLLGGGGDGEVVLRHVRDSGRPCRVVVLSGLNADIPMDADRLAALAGLLPGVVVLSKPTSTPAIAAHLFAALEAIP